MLTVLLENEGFAVRTAVNGMDALQRLDEACPALILLDLMMPVMSGDEFRKCQLADPRYKNVPVICMTAAHDGRDRAARIDADEYFQKPLDFEQLLSVVRTRTGTL